MDMAPNPQIMQAVERLGYRVTVGDVATQAGLNINFAQQGLLTLASETGGHLQVAETGEIAYQFPQNFRAILRNKYWQLQLQQTWGKIWKILFYLIRISFGILLVASIVIIVLAIILVLIAMSSQDDSGGGGGGSDGGSSGSGGGSFYGSGWDFWWFFSPDPYPYSSRDRASISPNSPQKELNFLEAIFSFLFGDGNPNADAEERRWHQIATVIRNNQGAVVAEQIVPYLDFFQKSQIQEVEDAMLPVLLRFNGQPEVSPEGEIVYHFPELQTTAKERNSQPVPAYFKERRWQFSQATTAQLILSGGLGGVNLIGAIILGNLLQTGAATQVGGFVAFTASIYGILLAYGIGFVTVPLIRYIWIQIRNRKLESRNEQRRTRAQLLNASSPELVKKMEYAKQFASQFVMTEHDLAYSTETDLIEQEYHRSEQIDQEWQQRLEGRD